MRRFASVVLALVALLAGVVYAQGVRATIVGRVVDESGGVIPGAQVSITNDGTNETRIAQTDSDGNYVIPELVPGQYTLTVEIPGFKKELRRGITLETSMRARMDVKLKVGEVSETVEVSSEAPLIQSGTMAL